jgi:hypothetical protein
MTVSPPMKIDLPYLLHDTDRHGNRRLYFRRRGQKMVRIYERQGTPEFIATYNRLLASSEAGLPVKLPGALFGSLRWLCLEYFKSSAFRQLDQRTQHVRSRRILEQI